jgi:molecular chaperone DnaJ
MNDPWKVLGVKQGSGAEEVKKAYRDLVKKYHPDRFQDPAAKEMANEKLKEINQAYDAITSGGARPEGGTTGNTNYTGSGSQEFYQVRLNLSSRNVDEAERILDQMTQKNAEWFFLRGVCYSMRGWYAMAREHLQNAVNMEPNNMEYRNALNQLDASGQGYRQQTAPFGGGRATGVGGCSTCDMCSCMLCSDCCCESLGGDCIPCC